MASFDWPELFVSWQSKQSNGLEAVLFQCSTNAEWSHIETSPLKMEAVSTAGLESRIDPFEPTTDLIGSAELCHNLSLTFEHTAGLASSCLLSAFPEA